MKHAKIQRINLTGAEGDQQIFIVNSFSRDSVCNIDDFPRQNESFLHNQRHRCAVS